MRTQRKYVNLIQRAESKWANWEPSRKQPDVGDYGSVNKSTGEFEWKGSIYSDDFAQHIPDLNLKEEMYEPVLGERDEVNIIKSTSAKQLELSATPELQVAQLEDASVKGSWRFRRRRGAVLVMIQPRTVSLPQDIRLDQLSKIPVLKDNYLVTAVVQCPAYAFYLSDKANDHVSLALIRNDDAALEPGLGASSYFNGNWWSRAGAGTLKQGGRKGGTDDFTPLFTLKTIRRPFFSFWR
ncbi:hypothetical protein FRB94_002624 [Tulasnella sp. JGI-2019a]|nr:hypothetical protein FRB93_004468 [Tulasnella sp. JGI-2019a]KAG9004192.1 hypothetical protein FRB94_002624 [Tulasnella sp. JGI-2019a]KAG9034635.1 hypothetical protein FRB95_012955 [Tulasnella sp. JGI-2019a]